MVRLIHVLNPNSKMESEKKISGIKEFTKAPQNYFGFSGKSYFTGFQKLFFLSKKK